MKATKLTIKGSGYHITCNDQNVYLNSEETFINSDSGGTDMIGSFQAAGNPNCSFQFEFNNPWIGCPWAAIGKNVDDDGWSNDRTNLIENEFKVFHLMYADSDDSGESIDKYVKVMRLDDTDTKNFIMELDYWPAP